MFLSAIKQYKHLQVIFDSISDMIFFVNIRSDGMFTYASANETAVRDLCLPKDFIGKTVYDIMPEHKAQKIVAHYQNAIDERKTISYIDTFITEGSTHWYESKVTPLFNQKNECEQIVVVTRDITENKRKEQALQRAKKELELIFMHAADALFTFDEMGRYLNVNPGFSILFGWSKEEIMEHPDITIFTEKNREDFQTIVKTLKEGNILKNLVCECITKEGNMISILASYSPMMDNGVMVGGIAMYKDITQYKIMEKLFKESELRFRQIAEHSSDLIRVIDKEGKIQYASPSHEKILGLSADFFLNKSALSFIHPDDMNIVQETIEIIKRTKAKRSIEFRRLNKKGKLIWMDSIGTPIINANEEVDQILFMSRDIGAKKRQESKLKHLAYYDSLTNLPNRRLFDIQLQAAMKASLRLKTLMAVFVLDCDHFKDVNDTYGHGVGDQVIQHFAERIKNTLREGDMVSRLGGDEFQMVLPDLEKEEDAVAIAQAIIDTMQIPFLIDEHRLNLTTSIGITFYRGETRSKKVLMEEADKALYQAKAGGRNMFCIYQLKKQGSRWKKFKKKFIRGR
ncbi:diguanylate cyclase (GGDEF)-like protein/PAS domain S-box-containing protein [Pullulanibacillus pueri]|uniref:Diguanylate cyclase n=1 Tax=Pullulanibacillus pueri TaxID=1437324 RepID=A0A8J2ZWC2_9BACL|nr:PAS domain S-box protein [Pullulanibacillus pueri]MBM7682799.1 diguanylate cyclase (GGDEF)-like protein/PAS domain S-box-containing protein [Pullulanibacillus pueri]GGH83230.1 hypothetical protein GCM10007096_23790 [Pullulanibacillus pueri]